jgi:hypothetical protein
MFLSCMCHDPLYSPDAIQSSFLCKLRGLPVSFLCELRGLPVSFLCEFRGRDLPGAKLRCAFPGLPVVGVSIFVLASDVKGQFSQRC